MQTSSSSIVLRGISSMATKALLADLTQAYLAQTGVSVQIESVGGVDAAKRVQAGEAFDMVLLASDAINKLMASGHVQLGSRCDWVRSPVAVAVLRRPPLWCCLQGRPPLWPPSPSLLPPPPPPCLQRQRLPLSAPSSCATSSGWGCGTM
jgi:hypothetical protein